MQLMVDLRINWFLFRVGNSFSIDSFYPLSGPANDIAFCVFVATCTFLRLHFCFGVVNMFPVCVKVEGVKRSRFLFTNK